MPLAWPRVTPVTGSPGKRDPRGTAFKNRLAKLNRLMMTMANSGGSGFAMTRTEGDEGGMGRDGTAALAAAALAVAGIAAAQAGPGITGLGPVRRSLFPRLAGEGDPGHVALTFDDGPDPGAT